MDYNNYRQLLLKERFSKDLNKEDYEDTLKHYAELYYKEKLKEITKRDIVDLLDELDHDCMDCTDRGYALPLYKPYLEPLIKTVKDWINKL